MGAQAPTPALPADTAAVAMIAGDSVTIRLMDVDLRVAVQALGRYLDRPVLFSSGGGGRITLETPVPVARTDVRRLLRGLVESQGLEFVDDTVAGLYRVRARDAPPGGALPGERAVAVLQGPDLYVIRLRHVRAADAAATINSLYNRPGALGEIGERAAAPIGAGPTLSQQMQQLQPAGSGRPMMPTPLPAQETRTGEAPALPTAPAAGPSGGVPVSRAARLIGEVTIVPDQNSNALFVRASAADFALIQMAVQQLDVRPLQVLIEVVIAEVRRDRSFSFGVEVGAPLQRVPGLEGVRAEASQKGIGLGDFALRILRQGPGADFDATLRASAARGNARILSRPIVLASNGETAEILVGSQRPFVQVQRSLPTDAPQRDQVVQYKDVGTRLSVRPTISTDGYESLAITQEVNAATAETQFDAPIISTRTVQTVLLVRDSQTVVLGGLSDLQREATQGGIPVLSSIPVLGGLFGRATRRSSETEFFLFLRPRIVQSDEDVESITRPYQRSAPGGDQ